MAKRTKQQLAELDEAIDQLGGGAAPIARPARRRTRSASTAKRSSRQKKVQTKKR